MGHILRTRLNMPEVAVAHFKWVHELPTAVQGDWVIRQLDGTIVGSGSLVPFGVAPAVAVAQGLLWQTLQVALALLGGLTAWLGAPGANVEPLAPARVEEVHPS